MLFTDAKKKELMGEVAAIVMGVVDTKLEAYNEEVLSVTALINDRMVRLEEEVNTTIEAKNKEFESKVQALFEAAIAADRAKRYDSDEPFVEIVSQTFSEEGGVQLRLDWNKAFIGYLRRNGFTGPSDESIVDNWLVSLSRERIAEGGSEYK